MKATKAWWSMDPGSQRAGAVVAACKSADGDARARKRADVLRRNMADHFHRRIGKIEPGSFSSDTRAASSQIVVNAALNVSETLTARICADRPRPDFVTSGGGWTDRYRAKQLSKFVLGEFLRLDTYSIAEQCQRDVCWADIGVVKVYQDGECIRHERIYPGEIIVDEQSCVTTPPRTLYHRRWVSSESLATSYETEIRTPGRVTSATGSGRALIDDMVEVVEAWHLPSGDGSGDGRRVICVDGQELDPDNSEWKHDRFPFAFIRWSELPVGFYGQPLQEQLAPLQDEANRLFSKFSTAMGLNAMRVFAEEGSFVKDSLTNREGDIVWLRKGSREPVIATPGSVAADAYQHAWRLISQQYEISGVSQMSAAGQRPTGELSGIALRTLDDMETLRHVLSVRRYQRFILDIAELTVLAAKDLSEIDPAYATDYVGRRRVERIKWRDVEIDGAILQLWPSNILPATPTGKLATVQDLLAAGLVDDRVALAMLDFPDLESHMSLESVELDYCDWMIERMMLDGEEFRPEAWQVNLALAIRRVGQSIMRYRMEGATDEDLEPLMVWLEEASDEAVRRQTRMQIIQQAEAAKDQQQAQQTGGMQNG